MTKMRVFRVKKTKKKQHRHFRESSICTLCRNESSSLKINKFCKCITKPEDYEFIKCLDPKGKEVILPSIRPDQKARLKKEYLALVPDIELFNDKIKNPEKYQPKKRSMKRIPEAKTSAEKNAFYQSWQWQTLRMEALNIYGRKCMSCNDTQGKLCVDHIKSLHTHWDLRLEITNLQILCNSCNMGKGTAQYDFRPINPE
jgi:5-methylcytosine-specific restriction endonuclease McrA